MNHLVNQCNPNQARQGPHGSSKHIVIQRLMAITGGFLLIALTFY